MIMGKGMGRKVVLLAFVFALLFSTLAEAGVPERGASIADSGVLGQKGLSDSEQSGSIDWWPMFRHDPAFTGYSTSEAPRTNATLWTYSLGTTGLRDSPVVCDGIVYSLVSTTVLALNASTGAFIWSNGGCGWCYYSSPAVAGGRVYVASMSKVSALNASTGALIWSYTTGGSRSSPSVADGRVYVGSEDNKVYALNASTGALIWNYTTGGIVFSSPSVADGRVFVGSVHDYKVWALNASTGVFIWSYTTGNNVWSSPSVADGRVYIASYDGKLYALNASNGAFIWSYTTGGFEESAAAVAGGRVYIASYNSKVSALNASTGAFIWSYSTGRVWGGGPSVAGGMVYVGSEDYKVYALNALTGAFVWSYKTASWIYCSPAIAGGRVYICGGDGRLYAFGVHDVGIKSVALPATEAYSGQTINITVVAKNDGAFNETFNIRTYYDSTLIETQTVTDLPPKEEMTLTISWDTSGIAGGYYTISANATTVPGETDMADNNFIDSIVTVTSPVRIEEVIPCNQTGYPKDTFKLGTLAFFKVTLNSTALIPQSTLVTINLYDNSSITISIGSLQGPLFPGTSTYIFGLSIPATATIGTATVYANCYTDWPSQGGFPHCPEASATLEITEP